MLHYVHVDIPDNIDIPDYIDFPDNIVVPDNIDIPDYIDIPHYIGFCIISMDTGLCYLKCTALIRIKTHLNSCWSITFNGSQRIH